MKRNILIILLTLLCLNASEDVWIDPKKKAILLDYAQDISEAKTIASKYKDHDIYIYNTIQNSNACCAIHIVNIKKSNMKSLLKKVQKDNSSAKELSRTRIRYFAKDMSPKNLFIESGEKVVNDKKTKNITTEIETQKVHAKQIIKNNLAQDSQEEWIDPTKKAILVKYVRNPKEADAVAQEYQNQDIYIHSTVKNTEACCAVYIVNIKKQNVQSILKAVSITTADAKKISNAKIKYFASDISPINKFIAASNVEDTPKEVISKKEVIVVEKVIEIQKEIIPKKEVIVIEKVIEVQKEVIIAQKETPKTLSKHIDIKKKAITIVTAVNINRAKRMAKTLGKYDIYIYQTKTTKIPYFVLYAVNIEKDKRTNSLNEIRKRFKDAYSSSRNRIKSLASNNFNSDLFISSYLSQTIKKQSKINLKPYTVKYNYNIQTIKMKPFNTNKITKKQDKQIVEKKIIQKIKKQTIKKVILQKNNSDEIKYNKSIDITKKAITIVTSINLNRAKRMAKTLSKYDIYIYQTTTTRVPYFIVYAVNILKENRNKSLMNIKTKFKDAYNSSNTRIKSLATNNFFKNIFIPSLKQKNNL